MVVCVGAMNPRRLGRTVQRLLEIETYRMMALLGLPVGARGGGDAARRRARAGARRGPDPQRRARRGTRAAARADAARRARREPVREHACALLGQLGLLRARAAPPRRTARAAPCGPADAGRVPRPAPRPGDADLRLGRAAPAVAVGAHLAHQQPAAHARRDRAAADQPGPARRDEPAPEGAAAAAGRGRGPVDRRGDLLRRRAGRLSRQGRQGARACRSRPTSPSRSRFR